MLHQRTKIPKKRNVLAVLNSLQQHNRVTRPDIARITGLTPTTVSNITSKLLEQKLIHVVGTGKSRGGRCPLILELHPKAFHLAGLKLGVSTTMAIVMDLHGNIISKRILAGFGDEPGESIHGKILDLVRQVIGASGISPMGILGIGISFPGLVDVNRGVGLYAPRLPGLKDIPLVAVMEQELNLFCALENDARASALGEARFGAGRGHRHSFFINMGPGIGSGIIINGDLYRGSNSTAGEFGHITVNPVGPECICGNRGCLEAMAGGLAIAASARRFVDSGRRTLIKDLVDATGQQITARAVIRAASQGDEIARSLLREAASYVGMALADVVNLLNPDAIIVGGEFSFDDEFLETIKTAVRQRSFTFSLAEPEVCYSTLGENASCIGAAALVLDSVFDRDSVHK